uniref:hypothetical protein n=1 Tax=Thaumasiovibrio occultus TaxID=1891184 RepID=UPI00131D48B0|nr:hypothetical protein [Thaumasiovibrio occultus]
MFNSPTPIFDSQLRLGMDVTLTTLEEVEHQLNAALCQRTFGFAEALRLVVDLYLEQRIANTHLDEDGDMLLFQAGAYGFGDEKNVYTLDITRQIISADTEGADEFDEDLLDAEDWDDSGSEDEDWEDENWEDDERMQQLSLSFVYSLADDETPPAGTAFWCASPESVEAFFAELATQAAFQWAQDKVAVQWQLRTYDV